MRQPYYVAVTLVQPVIWLLLFGQLFRFLVSPVCRGSLVTGQLGHQAVTTVVQPLVILALSLLASARFPGGAPSVLVFLVATVLLGAAFASFSNALALLLRRQESVVAAVDFLVLPLSFLSSTFMPANLLPGWTHGVARFNPVNWAVEVGRETLRAPVDRGWC